MLNYTEDFKSLYIKILSNYISIKVNEDAFNLKKINLNISINNLVVNNPFDIDDGWIVNFIPKDVGIVIDENNKKETFEKLSSEIFCFNSVHVFERMIIMLNKVLLKILDYDNFIVEKSVLNVSKQANTPKFNKILNDLKKGNLSSYLIIELYNDLIEKELIFLNDNRVKLDNKHILRPIEFLHKMKNYRNAIVHSDCIFDLNKDNDIYIYNREQIDDQYVLLMMDFSSIKKLLDAYKEIIYLFYTALNKKFEKEDELNLNPV